MKTFNSSQYSTNLDFLPNPNYKMDYKFNKSETGERDFILFLINQFVNNTKQPIKRILKFINEENASEYYKINIQNSKYMYHRCFSCYNVMFDSAMSKLNEEINIEKVDKGLSIFPYFMLLS